MNIFWKTVIVLISFTAAAQCLSCHQCPMGVFGSDITCNAATEQCYRGEAKFNATGTVSLHIRGCLDSDLCGKTLTGTILSVPYTSTFQCCNTDQCNGASSVHISLTAALSAAMLSSLWTWQL